MLESIISFLQNTGLAMMFSQMSESMSAGNWLQVIGTPLMIVIACVLLYLAIVKEFEPLLLLPIAFGMLLSNLPMEFGQRMMHPEYFIEPEYLKPDGGINMGLIASKGGLLDLLYLGVKLGIYPPLIFMGIGYMTDFGPLISNPKSLLLGAAAQFGVFFAFMMALILGALGLGFDVKDAAAIGIIGGADGPTAIYVTKTLAPNLLPAIAIAAYSYMALIPVIQPPIMKLMTTKKMRTVVMEQLRPVSKTEKILFPIIVTIVVGLIVPDAVSLVGCLMLGNLAKESGVVDRIGKTMENELMNIVTIFLGISVGATATAGTFLNIEKNTVTIAGKTFEMLRLPTIEIIVLGVVAFGVATAGGVLFAKLMNLFSKNKINPLIGSAGVSAVPMAARVSQMVGQKENPSNFLLMHAMGPNVAGVIGSAIAAGALIALFG